MACQRVVWVLHAGEHPLGVSLRLRHHRLLRRVLLNIALFRQKAAQIARFVGLHVLHLIGVDAVGQFAIRLGQRLANHLPERQPPFAVDGENPRDGDGFLRAVADRDVCAFAIKRAFAGNIARPVGIVDTGKILHLRLREEIRLYEALFADERFELRLCRLFVQLERNHAVGAELVGQTVIQHNGGVAVVASGCGGRRIGHDFRAAHLAVIGTQLRIGLRTACLFRRLLSLLRLFLQLIFSKAATAIRALETLLDRVENQIAAARRTLERNDLAHPSSLSL